MLLNLTERQLENESDNDGEEDSPDSISSRDYIEREISEWPLVVSNRTGRDEFELKERNDFQARALAAMPIQTPGAYQGGNEKRTQRADFIHLGSYM